LPVTQPEAGPATPPNADTPSILSTPASNSAAAGNGVAAAAGSGSTDAGTAANSVSLIEPKLPSARGPCPELLTGEAKFAGFKTRLWIGAGKLGAGPLLIYWYGAGSSPSEAEGSLGAVFDEILNQGGIVAVPAESTGKGTDTGIGTWSTGDLDVADEIVACAIARGAIDPRRIYTGGCSAGGLIAGTMTYLRSGYLAGAQLDSGGTILHEPLQEPMHAPAIIASHGTNSADVVIVNFAELSAEIAARIAGDGGFAVECDHGGGHCGTPARIRAAQWQFLMAHPFGTHPSPYANGLPAGFPNECRIVRAP
jgi:hypothetical protein